MHSRTVYVIGSSDRPVKIGVAADVAKRLAGLQTASPAPLIVHHAVDVAAAVAETIERAAHKALAKHRLSGEWFDVSADVALAAVEAVAAVHAPKEAPTRSKDMIDRLDEWCGLSPWARQAVQQYVALAGLGSRGAAELAALDVLIERVGGPEALADFKAVFAANRAGQVKFIWSAGATIKRAKPLADAVNALSERYAEQRTDSLALAIA